MRHKSFLFLLCGWLSAWTSLTTHAQTADERVTLGRQAWAAGDLNGANEQFAAAVAADPSHETANAFHALTRLLVLPEQPAVKSLLDRLGMGNTGRQILDWTASLPTDQAGVPLAPANFSAQEMITGLHGEVLPEVAAAAANLATITSPGFLLNLTAAETQSEAVTVDLGDLRLIRAGLHLTGYLGQTLNSWNFDAQLTALRAFAQDDERNLQAFLGQHPNLLACSGLADLAAARAEFTSFVENYLAASEIIRTRPANVGRLFNWDSESTEEEAAFRENLTALRASLNSPVPWPDRPALTVNLGRQFADCEAPRAWLPQFQGNALVLGTLPDPTLGGIVQGWTTAEIEQGVIDAAGESLGWEIQTVQSVPQKITGITATATSELVAVGRVAANAVNGIYYDTSFWESVGTVEGFGEDRDPAITFDLQTAHQLDHFLIWNSHEPNPAIKRMFVEVSLDGSSFTRLPGEFTLESNGATSGQKVLLGGVAARFVRFDILENYAGVIFPVVGNPIGWSLVAIDEVEFFGASATAPVISHHPASLTLTAGQTTQFTVAATGTPPLTYQWRKGGDAVEDGGNISGAAAATLTVVSVQAADAGSYDVVVSNAAGSIPSQPATLVVVPALPAITQQPQSQTVETGDTATFSVGFQSVEGLTYQWLKDGEELPGRTTSQLEISNAQSADEGEYRLRIANGLTSLLSNPATLTVQPPAVAPTITQQPMNVAATVGQTASFTVLATGTAPLSYQWRKGGVALSNVGNISGVNTAMLTLANVQAGDVGSYDVVVSNPAGSQTSNPATLTVSSPPLTGEPGTVDLSFNAGASIDRDIFDVARQADGKILIGGIFTSVDGARRPRLARLNPDLSTDHAFLDGVIGPNNRVISVATQPDGKVLIVGLFDTVNTTPRSRIARLNADGSLDASFNPGTGANGDVNCLAVQPDGRIVIGGNFTTFSGIARNRLARLNANGSLDLTFDPGTGAANQVWSLVLQPDGKVVIGGDFTLVNEVARNRLARLNADGSVDLNFNPGTGTPGRVETMALQPDGRILIGGFFTSVNGTSRNRVARLLANGGLDTSFQPGAGANDRVFAVTLQDDGKVVIGGWFTTVNGTSRSRVARLNANGSLDAGFNPGTGVNSGVNGIVLEPDGRIVIAGTFSEVNGTLRNRVARLNPDGSLTGDSNGGSGPDHSIHSLAVQPDGRVLVGGAFNTIRGERHDRVARLLATGAIDAGFGPVSLAGGRFDALALQPDGRVLIVGGFTEVNGVGRNGIARLNADGSLDTGFHPGTGANQVVTCLALQADGKVVIGGDFIEVNGVARNRIARLNPNGSLDAGFDPGSGADAVIEAVAVQPDGRVVLVGSFTNINGMSRNRIARLNPDGSLDAGFDPGTAANDTVQAVAILPDGRLVIGGDFTSVNGTNRNRVARLLANGGLDPSFDPGDGANNSVLALAVQADGRLIMGGGVWRINGTAVGRFARLNADGSHDRTFGNGRGADSAVLAIALQPDGKVMISGIFGGMGEHPRTSVARLFGSPPVVTITQPPASLIIAAGQTAQFTVTATGTAPLSYQWRKDGVALSNGGNVSGATAATLTLANVQTGDAGSYDVVVSNAAGSQTSDPATLTVQGTAAPITNFLEWYRADSAQFAELADGAPIVNWLPEAGSSAAPVPVQVAGQEIVYRRSVATLNGQPALEFAGGNSVINDIGKVDFNGVSMFLVFQNIGSRGRQRAVNGLDSNTLLGPWNPESYIPAIHLNGAWVLHPQDVVGWSDPATCVLSVVLDAVTTERSFVNGVETGGSTPVDTTGVGRLSFGGGQGSFPESYAGYIAEFILYKRVLSAAETEAVHDYLLKKYGLREGTTVAPSITQQPAGLAVTSGQVAQFTVTATGTAPLTYQWRKGGVALANGGNISGAETATLTLANVQPADAGSYDVIVSNSAGMDLSEAAVLLVEDPTEPQKITGITATATSELASLGRLAANAVNGVYLDGNFWESVGVGQGFGEDRDPAITFDLQAVHRLDHLLIWNSHEPPAAIKRMRIELSDDGVTFTALPGEFSLAAALDPQKLALGGSLARFVRLDILENHSGVIFPATGTPAGWSLVAIDEVEFFGRLNDQTPVAPTITQEPQDLTVTASQTAQFSVKATGSSPLSYQWRKAGTALADGGNISGATTATLSLANAQSGDAGNYDVLVSNLIGTETSSPASLTVNPAPESPTIVQHPANVTGVPAQSVTLSVTAVGTAPLAYQWFHTAVAGGAEAPVAGATSATLTLASLTPAHAGTYRVRVSNAVNPAGAFSQPATVTVVLLEHGFVTRLLPGAYIPGQTFEVVLEARPAAAVAFYAVFDQPPAGWTASGINEGGTFDTQTGRVKFGPFADNAARTLRYTLLPPASATGRHQFTGVASADGVDGNIRGSDAIENSLNHSADLNGDRQLVITEITGYGAAWKQGSTWSLPPNPVPVNYVTRAGFLWRNGERYRFDPAAGAAPLWWVPDTTPAPARSIARLALNAASSATRTFAERSVTLAVTPADAVSVYAVEERLFAGFTATGISHGGVFLPEQGLVRWGPFFDHQARELTYTVGAPAGFEGEIAVLGLVSEDGDSFPVTGDSVLRFGTAELPPPVTPEFTGDSFRLDVTGPLNARVIIETTDALGGAWTVATEFELNKPDQSWSVPVEIQESGKFFRVRVIVP